MTITVEFWSNEEKTEYAICAQGDQVFRATTDPSARYTKRLSSWTEPADSIADVPFSQILEEQVRFEQE
jgi:hypothetical protein